MVMMMNEAGSKLKKFKISKVERLKFGIGWKWLLYKMHTTLRSKNKSGRELTMAIFRASSSDGRAPASQDDR